MSQLIRLKQFKEEGLEFVASVEKESKWIMAELRLKQQKNQEIPNDNYL